MEGSKSGQPGATGGPMDNPIKSPSKVPSNDKPGSESKADNTHGATADLTTNDGGKESPSGQPDTTNDSSNPTTSSPLTHVHNVHKDVDTNGDSKDITITSVDTNNDSKCDTQANTGGDAKIESNCDTRAEPSGDSNNDTTGENNGDTSGDRNNNTTGDTQANGSGGNGNADSQANDDDGNVDTNDGASSDDVPTATEGDAHEGSEGTDDSGRISDTTVGAQSSLAPLQPGSIPTTDGVRDAEKEEVREEEARRELKPEDCEELLGYAFSSRKKWWILTVIFLIQTSMNFNTSLYSSGITGIAEEFEVGDWAARLGAAIFLVSYAFGCELWAPWSEELGRRPVLQLSLFLTNIWALPVVFAPSLASVLAGRFLGGLSTAGGSVTLGMIPDLYDSDSQQYAVAYIVFSSVGGSVLGPIVGGFVETLPTQVAWRWCIWIQIIFGVAVQLIHLFTVPETRTTIMLDKIAKERRARDPKDNVYGPGELYPWRVRFSWKELWDTWKRPFHMLIHEPIVMFLSMLSGFSDAIIFVQIQALGLVYQQWNFNSWQIGLAFIPIAIGYFIGWMAFIPFFMRNQKKREQNPHDQWAQYESRLKPMLYMAPFLPIGLLLYAWTSQGPPIHWIGTMFGTAMIGTANYAIYMATIDYMVCAYGPYSASATGGNGFARDLLAGILTIPAIPFYKRIGQDGRTFQYASTILGVISAVLVWAACRIYMKGPELRQRSPFAQHLALRDEEFEGHHLSMPPRPASILAAEAMEAAEVAGAGGGSPGFPATVVKPRTSMAADADAERGIPILTLRPAFGPASARGSYISSVQATSRRQSRQASRNASANPSRKNSTEAPHDHLVSGERLAARLQGLSTIDTVVESTQSGGSE